MGRSAAQKRKRTTRDLRVYLSESSVTSVKGVLREIWDRQKMRTVHVNLTLTLTLDLQIRIFLHFERC